MVSISESRSFYNAQWNFVREDVILAAANIASM
jgi:hypothetical protein